MQSQTIGIFGQNTMLKTAAVLGGFVIVAFAVPQFWWAFLTVGMLLFLSSFTGTKTEIIEPERQILSAGKEGGELSTSQFLIPQKLGPCQSRKLSQR